MHMKNIAHVSTSPPWSPLSPPWPEFSTCKRSQRSTRPHLITRTPIPTAMVSAPINSPRTQHGTTKRLTDSSKIDRKSTRLNSSHVSISYAVFCLTKKKQQKKVQNDVA